MMRNTDEEAEYWRTWTRLPSFTRILPLLLLLMVVGQTSAVWNTSASGEFNLTIPNPTGVVLNASSYTWPVILNLSYGNGSDIRCAYNNGTYTAIPTGTHGQMSNYSNGSILLAINVSMGIPIAGATITCDYGFLGGTNGTNLSTMYTNVIDVPTTDNCTTTATFVNTTYGVAASAGGGNMQCSPYGTTNNMRYSFIVQCLGNYTAGRPSPGWGDPSSNPYIAIVQNTTTSYLKSDAFVDSPHNVISNPPIGQFFYGEIDADPTMTYAWIIYLNGSVSAAVNSTGLGTTAAKSQFAVGVDASQVCGLTFSGIRQGNHGQRPQIVVSQMIPTSAAESVYVNLTSPVNSTSFYTPASVSLQFNCSGNSNSDYLANITINSSVVATGVACVNNATTTYVYNSSTNATYTWNVTAYNSSVSNTSDSRFFYVNASVINITLISPADLSIYPNYTTSTPISFNCSGMSNGDYLANLTVNGAVTGTGIYCPNNATTNFTINTTTTGTFVWSILAYNVSASQNSSTRTFYIFNYAPNISELNISISYNLGNLSANVTAQDAENTSLTVFYTWYKNGVNTSSGNVAVQNNTMTTINAALAPYTTGDKWDILVVASDGGNTSASNVSVNTTILSCFSAINYGTESAYSMLTTSAYLNFTLAGADSASAYFVFGASNTSMINSGAATNYIFTTTTTIAPYTATNTSFNGTWYYRAILANGSYYETTNISAIAVDVSGLFLCNSTINITSINYTILDQTTLLPLNATLTVVYTFTNPTGFPAYSFTTYNSTVEVCIYPPFMNYTATAVETVNTTGYQTNSVSRPSQIYNNTTTQATKLLLVASTTGLSNTITVLLTTAGNGAVGYQVLNYRYYPASNTYLLSASSITDNGGNVVQFLEPAPQLYRLVILDPSSIIVWNQSGIAYCTSGAPCTYTVVLENTNVDYATTLGSAFNHGALCSFNNLTNNLTCNYTSLSTTIPAITLNLTITNSSGDVVNTSGVAYTTNPSFLTIGVPNITGVYTYSFYGYFAGTTRGAQLEFRVLLENGYITIGTPATPISSIFGIVGWLLAALFSAGVALLFARIPAVMVLAGGGVFLVCSIIGLITLSPLSFISVFIATLIIAFMVK